MLKSELCLWNFPSLPPSLRAQVSIKAAHEAKPGVVSEPCAWPAPSLPAVHVTISEEGAVHSLDCLFHQNAGASHAGS